MPILDDLEADGAPWPPEGHADRVEVQADYGTLYRNDRAEIIQRWSADLLRWVDGQDELIPYPSAKLAARTLAAFLFGDDPRIRHEDAATQAALDDLSTTINLPARLLEGAITQSVEGEIYLRPAWDRDLSDWPILSTIPGSQVIPVFRHGMLREAAIVTTWATRTGTYRRLVEAHERGGITYRLYVGSSDRLGRRAPLDSFGPTRDYADQEEVATEIDDLLVTHVPLLRTGWDPHGVSLFEGLESLILGLHRLYSQEQHDAELARKRVAMPASYAARDSSGRARFDRRTDLFLLSEEAEGAIGSDRDPVRAIEFQDDNVMRERIRGRLEDFLIACGISPYTVVAEEGAGGAASGTARKLAQATTLRTVAAAARYWQDSTAQALANALQVARIHLGRDVPEVTDRPSVSLSDGLIDDPAELARILADLDTAEAVSTVEKVRMLHPEWDDPQVDAEVDRIVNASGPPPVPGAAAFGGDRPPGGDDLDDESDEA